MLQRYKNTGILAVLLTGFLFAFVGAANAQSKIAVVDMQRLLSESKAGQSIQKQLDEQRVSFQAEVTKLEQELKGTEQQLSKMQDEGVTDDLIQKKAEFEKKAAGVPPDRPEKASGS